MSSAFDDRSSPALVVSSLAFAVPAAVAAATAGSSWVCATMLLLLATSVVQHSSFVGDHPRLMWVDRAVATSLGLYYTGAAVVAGRTFAATCGVAAALLFAQSKRRCFGRRVRIAAHVVVHLLGALGVTAFATRAR